MRHTLHHGIFLRESGADRGARTILWIHGLGESALCFEKTIDRTELAGWRHIAPDIPGYGRTAWPLAPLPLAEQADLLADLCSDLGTGPVIAAGHSMGGVVALLLAERHPSLVRGVVDIDGNKSPADCTFSSQAADQDLMSFIEGGFDALRDKVYTAGVEEPAQRGYHASLCQADPAAYHLNSGELMAMSEKRDMATRLAALGMPRVYIAGAPDGASLESRRLLEEARVPVLEITPSGHWPFLDQADDFAAALLSFLREVG